MFADFPQDKLHFPVKIQASVNTMKYGTFAFHVAEPGLLPFGKLVYGCI